MFAGHQVPTRYYKSLAEALAQNGFAVMQVPSVPSVLCVCPMLAVAITVAARAKASAGTTVTSQSLERTVTADTHIQVHA